MNPANTVTVARLLLTPVIFYMILTRNILIALIVFLTFTLMDVLDGWLARKLNCETNLGKNLDLFSDSFAGLGTILMLLIVGKIPWLFILLAIPVSVLQGITIFRGVRLEKKTFIPSRWRKLTGAVYYCVVIAWLVNSIWSVGESVAYAGLAFLYVSSINYSFDLQKLKTSPRSQHRNYKVP